MEVIVKLIEQGALKEEEYDKDGQKQKFAKMPFVLQHGFDKLGCEMVQNAAREQGPLTKGGYYVANISVKCETYSDKNGRERFDNRITLNKITVL